MENRTYYYARVSSTSQHLDRQIDEFKRMGASERDIIVDKESGATLERDGYLSLKKHYLRPGDILVIKSLDRLSRRKEDIKNELQWFKDNKIRIKILDLPSTLIEPQEGQEWISDLVNGILIEVLSTMAERERINIRTRQAEGIQSAKRKGIKFGRPSVIKPDNWDSVYSSWRKREITAIEAMNLTKMKKTSFYKLADEQLLEDVINDLNNGKEVTVGQIQRDYWVSYPQAHQVYDKLVEQGLIKEGH